MKTTEQEQAKSAMHEMGGCGDRMSARAMLMQSTHQSKRREEALSLLIDLIPWNTLSHHQESLLYDYFSRRER